MEAMSTNNEKFKKLHTDNCLVVSLQVLKCVI